MNSFNNPSSLEIAQQLTSLEQNQFTGRLKVESATGKRWIIYLSLGRIVWGSDSLHQDRSWQRHLARFCPQVELSKNIFCAAEKYECGKYYILTVLLEEKKITSEKLTALVESKIGEILFDVMQEESLSTLQYVLQPTSAEFLLASGLKMSLTRINVKQALEQTQTAWSAWCEQGLERLSPNLAPSLKNLEQLQQKVSPQVYRNFVKFITGKRTLRDLAVEMNQDVLRLACSLVPYVNKGFLDLTEVSDLPTTTFADPAAKEVSSTLEDTPQPLVACIDDSPQILKTMEQIIRRMGYQFIGIREPLQAIPALISSHPDLIFLDIAMPLLNGYEIAAQLRRVAQLKETPVVMLTGQDGIVDRVRAKMVGASGFVSKPIEIPKIAETLEKFLAVANEDRSSQTSASSETERDLELVA